MDDKTTEPEQLESSGHDDRTVEGEVLAQVSEGVGGPRGAIESALPIIVFTIAWVTTSNLSRSLALGIGSVVIPLAVRLIQRSSVRFVLNGLIGIAIAGVIARSTGRAEAAFLPGIIQAAAWAGVLTISILAGRPLVGYLIGSVMGEPADWHRRPAIKSVSHRLTLVLLFPMVLRVAVQYPLYAAGEVGWLGTAKVALGWPLHVATLAFAGMILAKGRTPMPSLEDKEMRHA